LGDYQIQVFDQCPPSVGPEVPGFVGGSQGRAVPSMVVSVYDVSLGGELVGNVVVSADMLAHAVDQHDDARICSVILRGPAIAGEVPAVGGTIGGLGGFHHRIPDQRALAVVPARPRSTLSKNC
jgi:hypothetical protein